MKNNLAKSLAILLACTLLTACSGTGQDTVVPEGPIQLEEVVEEVITEEITTEDVSDTIEEEVDYIWTLVTNAGGLGDQGFNDLSHQGLIDAQEEFGGELKVVESTDMAQLVANLTAAARGNPTLVVGVGFDFVDAMAEVAPQYPDINFAIVDAIVEESNVASIIFKEHEGSFLGGMMAGMMTKTGVVGYVGGQEFPPVLRWQAGFEAGVKAANPDVLIFSSYVGTWSDPTKGKEAALAMYNNGADIIFEVCGGSALGIYEVAQEFDETKWVYGPDVCKHQLAPENTLPNVTKRVDVALLKIAKDITAGEFTGGVYHLGLQDGGMGLCEERLEELVPTEVLTRMEAAADLIMSGELVVPTSPDLVAEFEVPDF